MDLHLNNMSLEQIADLCHHDPDRIMEITLCMAAASKDVAERLYLASGALLDAVNHGTDPEGSGDYFDELVQCVNNVAKVTRDTMDIFRAVTEGARRAAGG